MEHITRNDPRIKSFLDSIDLQSQVRDIISSVARGAQNPGVINMDGVEKNAAVREYFVRQDHENLRVETYGINGHIVYWIFVKIVADPDAVFKSVIPRGLGRIFEAAEVEYWAELDPRGQYQGVWGVWVKNTPLSPSTKAYYQSAVPKRWNDALAALRTRS